MATDPISNKPPGGVNPTGGAGGAQGPAAPGGAGEVKATGFSVGGAEGAAKPVGATPAAGAAFEAIRSQILDGVSRGQGRAEIFDGVVKNRLTEQFGGQVSPETAARISQALQADPHMSSVFNQLFSEATRGGRGG